VIRVDPVRRRQPVQGRAGTINSEPFNDAGSM
jgi:hypothetical protein